MWGFDASVTVCAHARHADDPCTLLVDEVSTDNVGKRLVLFQGLLDKALWLSPRMGESMYIKELDVHACELAINNTPIRECTRLLEDGDALSIATSMLLVGVGAHVANPGPSWEQKSASLVEPAPLADFGLGSEQLESVPKQSAIHAPISLPVTHPACLGSGLEKKKAGLPAPAPPVDHGLGSEQKLALPVDPGLGSGQKHATPAYPVIGAEPKKDKFQGVRTATDANMHCRSQSAHAKKRTRHQLASAFTVDPGAGSELHRISSSTNALPVHLGLGSEHQKPDAPPVDPGLGSEQHNSQPKRLPHCPFTKDSLHGPVSSVDAMDHANQVDLDQSSITLNPSDYLNPSCVLDLEQGKTPRQTPCVRQCPRKAIPGCHQTSITTTMHQPHCQLSATFSRRLVFLCSPPFLSWTPRMMALRAPIFQPPVTLDLGRALRVWWASVLEPPCLVMKRLLSCVTAWMTLDLGPTMESFPMRVPMTVAVVCARPNFRRQQESNVRIMFRVLS